MFKKHPTKSLIALSVANVLAFSAASANAQEFQKIERPDSLTILKSSERLQRNETELVEVFVELHDEAGVVNRSEAKSRSQRRLNKLRGKMKKFRGTEMREKSNDKGMAWKLRAKDIKELKEMSDVKRVSYIIEEYPTPVSYTHLTLPTIYSV